jgi:hypothetical protein
MSAMVMGIRALLQRRASASVRTLDATISPNRLSVAPPGGEAKVAVGVTVDGGVGSWIAGGALGERAAGVMSLGLW